MCVKQNHTNKAPIIGNHIDGGGPTLLLIVRLLYMYYYSYINNISIYIYIYIYTPVCITAITTIVLLLM